MAAMDAVWYVDLHRTGPESITKILVSTIGMLVAYACLGYCWLGLNWARWLTLWSGALCIMDVIPWRAQAVSPATAICKALVGGVVILCLSTPWVRAFFPRPKSP
jgi:hypothetical protein